MIDYRYKQTCKRLLARFKLSTVERHWDRIVSILEAQRT